MNNKKFMFAIFGLLLVLSSMAVADFDGDGNPDLIVAMAYNSGTNGRLLWYEYGESVKEIVAHGTEVWTQVLVCNLDNDEYPDLIAGSQWKLVWYEATGNNTFAEVARNNDIGTGCNQMVFYDGAVYVAYGNHGIKKIVSMGNNSLAVTTLLSLPARQYNAIAVCDYDNDGITEIIVGWEEIGNTAQGRTEVYEEINGQLFSTGVTLSYNHSVGKELVCGYFDNDLNLDVFTSDDDVTWWEADGTDNNLVLVDSIPFTRAYHMLLTDLNVDGLGELTLSHQKLDGTGTGVGVYAPKLADPNMLERIIRPDQFKRSGVLEVGDWDLDGDIDLILGSTGLSGGGIYFTDWASNMFQTRIAWIERWNEKAVDSAFFPAANVCGDLGTGMIGDISSSVAGERDCVVDIYDLEKIVNDWLIN